MTWSHVEKHPISTPSAPELHCETFLRGGDLQRVDEEITLAYERAPAWKA
jgi:hypothetical protein